MLLLCSSYRGGLPARVGGSRGAKESRMLGEELRAFLGCRCSTSLAEMMRHSYLRLLAVTPQDCRARFGT